MSLDNAAATAQGVLVLQHRWRAVDAGDGGTRLRADHGLSARTQRAEN